GRFGKRPDVAALVLLLVFGAFANAAGMVAPVVEWQQRLDAPRLLTITLFYLVALVALPLVTAGTAAALTRWWSRETAGLLDVGLLLSLYTGYRIALSRSSRLSLALKGLVPWAVLILLLFAAGVWLVFQPMEMRGTLPG